MFSTGIRTNSCEVPRTPRVVKGVFKTKLAAGAGDRSDEDLLGKRLGAESVSTILGLLSNVEVMIPILSLRCESEGEQVQGLYIVLVT
jgi:hypothetical protein